MTKIDSYVGNNPMKHRNSTNENKKQFTTTTQNSQNQDKNHGSI